MALRKLAATLFAATALLAVSTAGLTGTAAAQTAGHAGFAAQVEQAGLTTAQARGLQVKVDHYLATQGGTQVAANKIAVKGGEIIVAVPGERYARDLARPASVHPRGACPYKDF